MCRKIDFHSSTHPPINSSTHPLLHSSTQDPVFRLDVHADFDEVRGGLDAGRKRVYGLHERAAQVIGFEIDHVVSLAGRSVA